MTKHGPILSHPSEQIRGWLSYVEAGNDLFHSLYDLAFSTFPLAPFNCYVPGPRFSWGGGGEEEEEEEEKNTNTIINLCLGHDASLITPSIVRIMGGVGDRWAWCES